MEKRIAELEAHITALEEEERKVWKEVEEFKKPYSEASGRWSDVWGKIHHAKLELQILHELKEQRKKGQQCQCEAM